MDIFYISSCVIFINLFHNVLQYIEIIYSNIANKGKPKLGTHEINKFFESAVFLEFVALGDVLDVVSPYNVVGIPNNWLTRKLLPAYCG